MTREEDVAELVPLILEENGEFAHCCRVEWTIDYLLEEGSISDVEHGGLHTLEVILETFQHRVSDLFKIFVVLLVEHFWDGV